jgi:hypothetical protein
MSSSRAGSSQSGRPVALDLVTGQWSPTLHWAFQKAKFEIHVTLCERVELNYIITHCLGVLQRIDRQVGMDNEAPTYKSLPRTMSMTLQAGCSRVLQ